MAPPSQPAPPGTPGEGGANDDNHTEGEKSSDGRSELERVFPFHR